MANSTRDKHQYPDSRGDVDSLGLDLDCRSYVDTDGTPMSGWVCIEVRKVLCKLKLSSKHFNTRVWMKLSGKQDELVRLLYIF